MTTTTPTTAPTNKIGLTKQDYMGAKSTLCAGCGHDAITAQIIQAAWEMGVEPHRVAKLSGIGCSSKTPTYFLSRAWGFNSVHGRAAAVCTGVALANRELTNIIASGDGDSMSIGMGQFTHMIRRNVPVVYILEDNGVYGLTKGQFSATADVGSVLKKGEVNELPPIDPCTLAMELGCGFVARAFSGNPKQLNTLLKAAFAHRGTALIDVISPCVTFNNHEGSTRSYKVAKEKEMPLQELGFVPYFELNEVEIPAGEAREVTFPDGSRLTLRALTEDYDPTDRYKAQRAIHQSQSAGEFLTGLLYVQPDRPTLQDYVHMVDEPLAHICQDKVKPSPAVLAACMEELM
ncbi:MAG: 2-oxoacid:ferredoxin oxidoreductase subunit beta [Firmicutes bacterium]|nr:2-oxoacid:ferredoxin oxidoreductase subunit beta [Bacillota bacterium]